MESGAGKQKDGIWKTNFGRKEEVVAYGIGLLVFLEKQWKCGNAYVTMRQRKYQVCPMIGRLPEKVLEERAFSAVFFCF